MSKTVIKVAEISAKIIYADIQEVVAKGCAKEISNKSPKLKGNYKKGWTTSKFVEGNHQTIVVHNKDRPTLTHLLENGHLTRLKKGGKGKKRVAPQPHIRPAVNKYTKKYIDEMKKIKIEVKSKLIRR